MNNPSGMEVRLMAVVEVERLGVNAREVATKANAMGMLQSCASHTLGEPEARARAAEGIAQVQNSMKEMSLPGRQLPKAQT